MSYYFLKGVDKLNLFRRILKSNWDIIFFSILIFIKLISVNSTIKLNGLSSNTMIGTLGTIFIFMGIAYFFNNRIRAFMLIVFNIFLTAVIYIDNIYHRYFLDVTTISLVKQLGLATDVGDSIFALLKLSDIIYALDIILILVVCIKYRKKIQTVTIGFVKRVIAAVALIAVGVVFFIISSNGLNSIHPGILGTLYEKKAVVKEIGLFNYHVYDIDHFVKNNMFKKSITKDEKLEVENFFKEKNEASNKKEAKYKGIAKDKNLIVIQLEAFQAFVLNKEINGVEITPNLNKLAKESLNFNNFYFQTSIGGTSDAEFLTNNSLLPSPKSPAYYLYSGNTFNSLTKTLKAENYYTSVMHANKPGFWNRQEMYRALGFDTYEHEEKYNKDDLKVLGLSDKSFLKQNIEKIKSHKEPFYSFMITLTSHYPFKDSKDGFKDIIDVGELDGELIGDFIKAAKYTDEALGEFIENLKKEGLYDNTVIALYGDHAAVSSDKREQLAKAVYDKNTMTELEWLETQKVVSMIHVPNSDLKGEINTASGQMDMYPTLLNLLGIEKPKYMLGQDILNADDGFVVTRHSNFFTNKLIYVKGEDKLYDRETYKELNKNDYKEYFDKMNKYFTINDRLLDYNLLKELNSK